MCDRPFRANHPNHGDNPSRKHATHTRESTLSTTSKPSKKPRYSVSGVSYPFFGQKTLRNHYNGPICYHRPPHRTCMASSKGTGPKQNETRLDNPTPMLNQDRRIIGCGLDEFNRPPQKQRLRQSIWAKHEEDVPPPNGPSNDFHITSTRDRTNNIELSNIKWRETTSALITPPTSPINTPNRANIQMIRNNNTKGVDNHRRHQINKYKESNSTICNGMLWLKLLLQIKYNQGMAKWNNDRSDQHNKIHRTNIQQYMRPNS